LHERRQELREDLQRLELAGLRAVVAELTPSNNRQSEGGALLQLAGTPRRRGELPDAAALQLEVPHFPDSSPRGRALSSEEALDIVDRGPEVAEAKEGDAGKFAEDGAMADIAASPFGSDAHVLGEAAAALDTRRRELRRERTALEELRRQWKSDSNRIQSSGSVQAQTVLADIRAVLDERTANLNKMIDEHRVLERAVMMHRSVGKSPAFAADLEAEGLASTNKPFKVQADTGAVITPSSTRPNTPAMALSSPSHELDLIQRWQHLLSSGHQSTSSSRPKSARAHCGASPRSSSSDKYAANWNRRARTSRGMIDQHLLWMRTFQRDHREIGSGRPLSARASTRFRPDFH